MSTPSEPISGTPQQTYSGKPGNIVFQNPPFHPNILNIGGGNNLVNPDVAPNVGLGRLHRGFIVSTPDTGSNAPVYRINFLYNPSTIQESRGIDLNNGALPSKDRVQGDITQYATGLNTTVNFSLLFDRTFELWDSSYIGTDEGTYGVRVDVEAFYNMVGINQPSTSSTPTVSVNDATVQNITTVTTVQGPMLFQSATVYFGHSARSVLSYYGWITQLGITYSHFTVDMVPSRCEIDVSFTVLPQVIGSTTG